MTTVGYGDRYPVTSVGRQVAFGLMVGGIALLGTITAMLASWLVETVAAEKEQAEDLQLMIKGLEAKVDRLTVNRRGEESPRTKASERLAPDLQEGERRPPRATFLVEQRDE